jgi:hypothetical protein
VSFEVPNPARLIAKKPRCTPTLLRNTMALLPLAPV